MYVYLEYYFIHTVFLIDFKLIGENSGSHGDEYEDDCLLEYCAMHCVRYSPTFQRCLLSPLSGRWVAIKRPNCPSVSTRVHGAAFQMTAMCMC
jgi:hypothetical protein